jgi:methionyl aminopeptidase
MILKSPREIEIMHAANRHVAEILALLAERVRPGISTGELDDIAAREIKKRNVKSAFLGYHGFPARLCTSINEEVVHGIPSYQRIVQEGDILSIDFGVVHRGYVGDSAVTLPVGAVSVRAQLLMNTTRDCLMAAIAQCTPDHFLGVIGDTIEPMATANGFSVVRNFVGHGIGTAMHEEPQVPHFRSNNRGPRLRPGLVIAIEPMINAGTFEVDVLADGWTAVTRDRELSAHFEHSIAITEDGPRILSQL